MESNNTVDHGELLAKLTRLEDQVATLSSQLESNHLMIGQLKLSISDRDAQIRELESRLMMAQQSLQTTAIDKIVQCREQIKSGIDAKIVHPVLTQIQKTIETIEGLVAESKDFINKKKAQLSEGFVVTSNLVRQSPDQAMAYLEKSVFEPMTAMLQRSVQLSQFYCQKSRFWFEQELVNRCKALVEHISFVARELSLNTKIILQTRVINPIMAFVDNLPSLIHKLSKNGVDWQKLMLGKINRLMQESLEFMMDLVKSSSFWDGKHRMQGAT